jgi:MarR family transcriptional regulator, organic hydroperoxide resistance regulator
MVVISKFNNTRLKTWLLLHKTYNLAVKVEDNVFAKVGLTSQQHAVLMAMKYNEGPITPSCIAHWLNLNTNTISTLVDRMEKIGLVKRKRDLRDRRSVRLVMTKKGKEALDAATNTGWQVILELFGFPEEELKTLTTLLETVRGKALNYINPGKTILEAKTKYQH